MRDLAGPHDPHDRESNEHKRRENDAARNGNHSASSQMGHDTSGRAAGAGGFRGRAIARQEKADEGGEWPQQGEGGGGAGRGGTDGRSAWLPARRTGLLAHRAETRPYEPRYARAAEQDPDDLPFDVFKYLGLAIKHRWLIAGITAATLFLGLFYTLLQTPLYRGTATIEIKRDVNISGLLSVDPDAGRDGEFHQRQAELLRSRALAQRVVAELGLAEDSAFLQGASSGWSNLRGLVMGSGQAASASDISQREGRAVSLVRNRLNIELARSSGLVRVSYDSPDPALAQRLANGIADTFITFNLDRRYGATAHARGYLEERLDEMRVNLEESERALVDYAESEGIVPTGDDQNLSSAKLDDVHRALREAERELLRQQTLWRQVESGEGGALLQRFETEAIEQLRSSRAELAAEYQQKLVLFKPDYPEMANLQARINEIDRQIAEEGNRIKESLRLQYEAALEEHTLLADRAVELTREVMDFQSRNVQYTILTREVDTNRSLYDGLLQRYKEIGVSGGIDESTASNNVAFVDRASRPNRPYTPSFPLNLGFALVLGVMFGGSAAFVRELLDQTFKAPEEIEETLGLPLLGIIPRSDEVDSLQDVLDQPHSALGEAYRSLRTALQFSTASGVPKSLLVTSTQPGEGKSTVSLSLARNFTKLGLDVLLIDGDMRKPSLHHMLGCDATPGLSNILVGGSSPPLNFQTLDDPKLTFLPCGSLPSNPGELLSSARMASLIAVAAEKFDLVIIDGPPVGGMADAPLLGSLTSGTLMVVEAHRTLRKRVMGALKRLDFARAELIGVVFNKFDSDQAGYGYGDYGYYGYGDYGYYGYGAEEAERLEDEDTQRLTDRAGT